MESDYQAYVNSKLRAGEDAVNILTYEDFVQKQYETSQRKERSVEGPLTPTAAATKIQRAWRRHIDVQVYRYYRDLINFKNQGDPAQLLRCINPSEASLLDAAFGGHVKFRLAGQTFPPNIYYKIFTHRPVQDLCANSPKDYTRAGCKLPDSRTLHNRSSNKKEAKVKRADPASSRDGWYQRIENNGWRLVSDRVICNIRMDPVTWDTDHQPTTFHHNSYMRREEVQLRRKHKKIEWMRKMYEQEMLRCRIPVTPSNGEASHMKTAAEETNELVAGATRGMLKTVELLGEDSVQDWEIDELLEWTTALNFDKYQSDWKQIATSATSEQQIDLQRLLALDKRFTAFLSSSRQSSAVKQEPPRSGLSYNTPNNYNAIIPEMDEHGPEMDSAAMNAGFQEPVLRVSVKPTDPRTQTPMSAGKKPERRVVSEKGSRPEARGGSASVTFALAASQPRVRSQ